jgi:hypothetical protein
LSKGGYSFNLEIFIKLAVLKSKKKKTPCGIAVTQGVSSGEDSAGMKSPVESFLFISKR